MPAKGQLCKGIPGYIRVYPSTTDSPGNATQQQPKIEGNCPKNDLGSGPWATPPIHLQRCEEYGIEILANETATKGA